MLKGEENELPGRGGKPVFRVRPTSLTLGRPYTLNLSIPICDVWIIRPMWRGITENLCRVAALVALRARTLWRPWVAVMGSEGQGPSMAPPPPAPGHSGDPTFCPCAFNFTLVEHGVPLLVLVVREVPQTQKLYSLLLQGSPSQTPCAQLGAEAP